MRYSQIKQALKEAEIIDEVSMSPSSLEKFANSPEAEGMLMGIEFEMCVPNANVDDDSGEGEYDYDMDERANDIDDIIRFFQEGEMSNLGSSSADRLRGEMWEQYLDWQSEQISENLDQDELNDRIRDRLDSDIDFDDMMELAREQWTENNPDENPESKEAEDEIHQMALRLNEKTLDNMMADTDSRDYQRAYDDIRQEMEDDMRDNYDQSDWLSDLGVSYMSEAEREWGLDWPHWTSYSSGGEADVDQVADDFSDYTGFQAKGYNNYHSASRSDQQREGYFIIEPDGSIDADEGDAGLEFISPAMPLKDGIEMLKKVKEWASAAGCYTNKSTGLHMNISVPNMTIDNLDYVKLALFLGDEHVLKEFDRTYNSYAKSAMKIVREKIQQNPENATALLAKMKEHLNAAASKLIHSGITNKYTSINTKDKYVEFRGPGGDYLDQDLTKLTNTALRLAQSLRIATDDNAYKQEYAKKLYKLVSPNEGDWTDPNNSVALFSRYALGQLTKAELVDNVRQAQTARKEKKGEEVQYWVMNKNGSGGKQMVFAPSETAAIILGGKQLGMNREQSISKLKAELFRDNTDSVPDSVPESWKGWVEDTLPRVTVEIANSVRQRIIDGGDQLSGPASAWIIKQIDNELRDRMDQGVTDGNETRWKVNILAGTEGVAGYDPVYVDADSPRQAKVKAVFLFSSEQGIHVNVNNLDAIATTQDAGREELEWSVRDGLGRFVGTVNARSSDEAVRIYGSTNDVDSRNYTASLTDDTPPHTTSREVFDSLPSIWTDYLQDISSKSGTDLQRVIDNMAAGVNAHYTNLTTDQKDFVLNTINQELRRRGGNNELAANAGGAENAVRDSLPQAHREWLDNVTDKSDMDLINVLRNVSTTAVLNDQQTAYFRVIIKRELRRRGISDSERDASEQGTTPQTTATDFEVVKADGSVVSMIRGADMVYAHRKARELEQDLGLESGALTVRALPTATNESIKDLRRLAGLR